MVCFIVAALDTYAGKPPQWLSG